MRVNLLPDGGPLRQRAPVAEWVPDEDDRLAVPVKEVAAGAVARQHVAQGASDGARASQRRCVALQIDRRGEMIAGRLLQQSGARQQTAKVAVRLAIWSPPRPDEAGDAGVGGPGDLPADRRVITGVVGNSWQIGHGAGGPRGAL